MKPGTTAASRKGIRSLLLLLVLVLSALWADSAGAAPAQALGYVPKYAPGFDHFDYVNPRAPRGGELILSARGAFDSFNPFILKGLRPDYEELLMFETLMQPSLDEPFSQYGLLADDAQLAADKLSVTFHLNPAARFSDGSPVLADDVKFSFDTLKSDKAHPQYRVYWADIERVVVVDERTVRFEFKRVNPELHMIAGQIPIFSRHWVGNKPFDKLAMELPIASGPYRIASYDMGRSVTYERRADYWGDGLNVRRGMFNFQRITLKYYRDATAILEGFKAGEFEISYVNSAKQWARDYVGKKFDDGRIIKARFTHRNDAGMQGFAFNTRRDQFKDVRVRRAIALAMDFEWSNDHLFYGQYTRCDSYFSNSEMAATGVPEGAELALLEPLRDHLPKALFERPWRVPTTTPPHSLRENLREAERLLNEAGWHYRDGVLQNAKGERLQFEVLLNQKEFERVLAPFARNLAKLGIQMTYRTVDPALYQRRGDTFDFDMLVTTFGESQSPGNELFDTFYSKSKKEEGSNNLAGVSDPAVDALVEKVVFSANDRSALVTAARALDRVLLWGEYVVPNWYIAYHRVAYWDHFGIPKQLPLYYMPDRWAIMTWWKKG